MAQRGKGSWRSAAAGLLWPAATAGLMALGASPGHATEVTVKSRPVMQGYYVSGDAGRFREDRKMIDQTSGGLEEVTVLGDGVEFTGHALVKYDYAAALNVTRDEWYLDTDFRQFRAYYDGSNEPWDPGVYLLPDSFADATDDNMYVNWTDAKIEGGYNVSEALRLISGIEFWGRDGKKTLLRGSRARATGVAARLRSIPATRDMEGRSETYYVEVPFQPAEGYGLTFRQSFENYRDDHDIRHFRYNNGAIEQARTFFDYPGYDDLRTQVTASAEPTEDVLVTGGYLYQHLENETTRASVRTNLASPNHYINPDVKNVRQSHVVNNGLVWSNVAGLKDLRFSAGLRGENADTEARGHAYASEGTVRREAISDLEEKRFAESFGLTYTGIPRTSVSATVDYEQRVLHWSEFFDAQSHEIEDYFGGPDFMNYAARIRYSDQVYTLRLTNRPIRWATWGVRYRQKDKIRDYTTKDDTTELFYPGRLGDQDQDVNELQAKADFRLPMGWMTGVQYEYVTDTIGFGNITEEAQELTRNRVSASLLGPLTPKVTLMVTGMLDSFFIETPTNTVATDWNPGDGAYDYDGDLYLVNTFLSYTPTNRLRLKTNYQQTASQGDNKNILYEFGAGLTYKLAEQHELDLEYEYFNFHDRRIEGPGFDDYDGHGLYMAVTSTF